MNNYPRGSEWRKWDLHFHTPSSYDYKNKSITDEEIISILKKNNISVVAITDHHIIDVERVWNLYQLGLKNNITVLAGIEFLSDTRGKEPIHFIGIFNIQNKRTLNFIWEQLKNKTNIAKIYGESQKENEIYCDLETTTNLIHKLGGLVTIHAGAKHSSIECITNALPHTMAQKKDIADFVDIFEIGKKEDEEGYVEKVFPIIGYKPMILCSDNHDIKNYHIKTNCWIKADPTFEGLKQIIYEPEERVKIQEKNPQKDYSKHYFSKISINDTKIFVDGEVSFKKTEIPLNPNLVAIIGGRGTGKSLLLDSVAKTFQKNDEKNIVIANDDFSITYTKSDGTSQNYKIQNQNALDYLHIPQGHVRDIVDPNNPDKLDREIKRLLNLRESQNSIEYYDSSRNRLIDELFEIKDYLNKRDKSAIKINSKEYIKAQIKEKETLIENITTKENQKLISLYTTNLILRDKIDKKIKVLDNFKEELIQFQEYKNNLIKEINSEIEENNKIPSISFDTQIKKIENLIISYQDEKRIKEQENEHIKQSFRKKGISGDITTLLEQTKRYQVEINELKEKLNIIKEKEMLLQEKFEQIKKIIDRINENNNTLKTKIKNNWNNLKSGKENWTKEQKKLINILLKDIEIEIIEEFDEKKFYEKIKSTLNLSKFRETYNKTQLERIKEFFNINSKDKFIQLLKDEMIINFDDEQKKLSEIIDSDIFVKDGAKNFLKILLLSYHDFWKVITKPKYKNKELHQLSVGMKGTMYLCLKLATDPFIKPFIFDQPEDDLDNSFIVNELVPIFKKIKKYRQVIIVTHNANLVVNADAEQIIVAQNNDEVISYESGSIENPKIRDKICKILEGGKDAFLNREKKYGTMLQNKEEQSDA